MARGKSVPKIKEYTSVEQAIRDANYPAARQAMAVRLAHMFDNTDSARDVKALSMSLAPLVDACEQADRIEGPKDTQLDTILAEAEKVLANA